MSKKNKTNADQDSRPTVPKPLAITPQISVTIHGEFPNQWLTIQDPRNAHTGKTVLTAENCYAELMYVLQAKAGEIELERQLAEERNNRPKRKYSQPDWRLIAQHPGVDGTTTIIERLPTIAPQLNAKKSEHTLEEMGL